MSHWLALLRAGDVTSAQPLWEHYFEQLLKLVRTRLPAAAGIDHEGLAASAFRSFWVGAVKGQFPRLDDRDDLWKILVTIVGQKVADAMARMNTLKRGKGYTQQDQLLLEDVIGREPTPEMAVMVTEQVQRLLDALENDEYRRIAMWKLEGRTNAEIAKELGCALRTVTNRMDVIRKTLTDGDLA